ncbi:hypothetical protein BDU57DRAFT_525026 [Ampelomyces quisqualis]|uniref:Uncharacterized protein n=1 Tax=Ampelomyces quisqualis TaxID=50730 RepID=A0A6A5Q4F1_AMPQU|nr:hypothetical protein BDU57DRAFT_525026 [Ampelomyces quisqualis]
MHCFHAQLRAFNLGLLSHPWVLDAVMYASTCAGALLALDTVGVLALAADLGTTAQRWYRGDGWGFAWGWSKNRYDRRSLGEGLYVRAAASSIAGVGQPERKPWVRHYGEYP